MAQLSGVPIIILKEGTERKRGRDAQKNNISAAKAVAEAVRTTLGPKGMDKMLVDSLGDVTITNDGATILDAIDVEHPAAKMIIEIAKTQDEKVGDGTTSSVIIAGELLNLAEELMEQTVHPTIIFKGYRKALLKSKEILKEMYHEVVELGPRKNEDFIKREFHMDLDKDENNSEEHVVVLIQGEGRKKKMTIQVTYFEAKRTRIIKYAKDIKTIFCHIKGDRVEIKKSDYTKNDMKSLFPDILQGIRNKKKFLKLLDRKDKIIRQEYS